MDNLQYHESNILSQEEEIVSFKPYYKWITFNTTKMKKILNISNHTLVLNLIING